MLVSLLLTLLAVCVCGLQARPSFIENDSIVFPDDNDTTPSDVDDKLKECLKDNFKIEFNGECRTLLSTENVCPEGQWLVLDVAAAARPRPLVVGKCATRRCAPKLHYWVPQRRCVPSEAPLCPSGNTVTTDNFGDGFCECVRDPVHIRDRDGQCYPVFTRGPCAAEKVWVKINERGECRLDNCTAMRARFPGKIVVRWSDGRCYVLNERGPCKQGNVIRINPWSTLPECGDPLTALHLVDPPCATDHTGKCRMGIATPQNIFLNQLQEQVSKKRTRKSEPK